MSAFETTEKQRAQLALLKIEDAGLNVLRDCCRAENLNAGAWALLVWDVIHLADFERHIKPQRQTQGQRLDALKEVDKAAASLSSAIEGLSTGNLMELDSRLFFMGVGPPKDTLRGTPTANAEEELFSHVDWAARTAGAIATAAKLMLSGLAAEGVTKLGRKRVLGAYAGYIAPIACQLMPHGVKPGDNGPFRRICDAVFSAAGVPATSQGAIKYFLAEMRPNYRERGLCL